MEIFTLDNKTWDIIVLELTQKGEVTDTDKAGRSVNGTMIRDIIGTYYNYTIKVAPNKNNFTEYDKFFTAITAPVDSHVVSFPHNQTFLTFNAYITSANRSIQLKNKNGTKWKDMTINFIAMAPQIRK